MEHQFKKEIETIKAQATLGFREDDQNFKEKLEVMKEDGKNERFSEQQETQQQEQQTEE
jgi:hypothetical protein